MLRSPIPTNCARSWSRSANRGYSITIADVQPFTGSMAAPIRDASGTVIASLCFIARKTLIQNVQRRDKLWSTCCTRRIWRRWTSAGGPIRSMDGNRRPHHRRS